MAKKSATLCVRVTESTRNAVAEFAAAEGVSVSEATEMLILRGFIRGCTVDEIQEGFSAILEEIHEEMEAIVRPLRETMDEVVKRVNADKKETSRILEKMASMKKTADQGAQAALANYAFTALYSRVLLGAEPDPGTMYVAGHLKSDEIYDWFWNIGGFLCQDAHPRNYIHAFSQTPHVLVNHRFSDVMGIDEKQWDELIESKNAAARSQRGSQRRNRNRW